MNDTLNNTGAPAVDESGGAQLNARGGIPTRTPHKGAGVFKSNPAFPLYAATLRCGRRTATLVRALCPLWWGSNPQSNDALNDTPDGLSSGAAERRAEAREALRGWALGAWV